MKAASSGVWREWFSGREYDGGAVRTWSIWEKPPSVEVWVYGCVCGVWDSLFTALSGGVTPIFVRTSDLSDRRCRGPLWGVLCVDASAQDGRAAGAAALCG